MKFILITDSYAPSRTSVAVLLEALTNALVNEGNHVCVVVPSAFQAEPVLITFRNAVEIISVKALETKNISYFQRFVAELINPYLMCWYLWRTDSLRGRDINGVLWYSPSIFFRIIVRSCQKKFNCPSYLILRDIFPDWALDLGVLKKGLLAAYLAWTAKRQYEQATWIGLQSPENLKYFQSRYPEYIDKAEVLWNWVSDAKPRKCPIQLKDTSLAEKKIAVYAGNIGISQGRDTFLSMVEALKAINKDMGFVFIGRGAELKALQAEIEARAIPDILFFHEIQPDEMLGLYQQCHIGLLALDIRHKTHNIPGKFISYMQAGIPVFGIVNKHNDLINMVANYGVGFLCASKDKNTLEEGAHAMLKTIFESHDFKALINNFFLVDQATQKILTKFNSNPHFS